MGFQPERRSDLTCDVERLDGYIGHTRHLREASVEHDLSGIVTFWGVLISISDVIQHTRDVLKSEDVTANGTAISENTEGVTLF